MLFFILNAQMAMADCELEPSVIDDIGPGETVEITRLSCDAVAESCDFRIESSGGGQLTPVDVNQVVYTAPADVQCEIPVVIVSDCNGTDLDQSINFNVLSDDPCKLSGGGCNSPGYGWLFITPLLFRRRQAKGA